MRFKGFYNDGIELFYSAEGPKETNVTARIPYESVKRVEWGGHDAFTDDPNAPHIFCTFNQMNGPYDFHLD